MASITPTTARAASSCRRCSRRKKKCDRLLPECEMCKNANVACSFLSDDRQVGSYPIAYVRNLEGRVKELEALLSTARVTTDPVADNLAEFSDDFLDVEHSLLPPEADSGAGGPPSSMTVNAMREVSAATAQPTKATEQHDELVDGLKLLSLEATAERYLGSASGLSFAKLTQTVLRRLTPDKTEFVFTRDIDDDIDPVYDFADSLSPTVLFDSAALLDWNLSPRNTPPLFGGLSLSHLMDDEAVLASLKLPEESHMTHLTDFYFAHSHTLYPIIRRNEFMPVLWRVRDNPDDILAQSPLWLFRIWMVLAVGSTSYYTVSLVDESESVLYYNKAMSYFEKALDHGDMAALEVLMLQVSYSFFNQLGPNTWFLVGIAARLALGMGLHTSATYDDLPADVSEYRKRLFCSLYMMDRVVSTALGRPFAMSDRDIDVLVSKHRFGIKKDVDNNLSFTAVDDENIKSDGLVPQSDLRPSIMAIPLHILALRKIASEIADGVYSVRTVELESARRDERLETIHKKLIKWRREMPFPLPDINSRVPHLCSSWFDFNYYTHVVKLYRPSPLCPTLDAHRLDVLTTASSMSIREAMNLHRQNRFAYNWLNLLALFTSTMSLIYTTTVQPEDLSKVLKEGCAIADLDLAVQMFDTFAKKFTVAKKIVKMTQVVRRSFEDYRHI